MLKMYKFNSMNWRVPYGNYYSESGIGASPIITHGRIGPGRILLKLQYEERIPAIKV